MSFTRYKVQFSNQWRGAWKFEALNDFRAWKIAQNFIKEHTSVVIIEIESIHEINESGECIRKIPEEKDCVETKRKSGQKKEKADVVDEKAMYKAHFSDGECSGPYIAKITDNDAVAIEIAAQKLKHHVEYNRLNAAKVKVTQINEP